MPRTNVPLVTFNRGIIDQISLGRVDLDRALLSAEKMTNWVPKTQGAMRIRPGMKYIGSTHNDTGAFFIEFVESTDDKALLELTPNKMRVWDSGEVLLKAPTGLATDTVTTLSLGDGTWVEDNTGGGIRASSGDAIPTMNDYIVNGVKITASSDNVSHSTHAWRIADNQFDTRWQDTGGPDGAVSTSLPSWINVDFGGGRDTGTLGNNQQTIGSYTVRAGHQSWSLDNAPVNFRLLGSNEDTGVLFTDDGDNRLATDTGAPTDYWTLLDDRRDTGTDNVRGWGVSEERTFTVATPGAYRNYNLYVEAVDGDTELMIAELELFPNTGDTGQSSITSDVLTLNAGAIGSLARVRSRVAISDTGAEQFIHAHVDHGPVVFRVGTDSGADDLISETRLGVGHHRLAFTPETPYVSVTLQTNEQVDRIVSKVEIVDTGTIEVATPWDTGDLDNIRFDQSADVVFVDCEGVKPHRIERRGTGNSWSVVENTSTTGPFRTTTSTAKMSVQRQYGNTTLKTDIPFFEPGHKGALFRLTHEGQSGKWLLGNKDAVTDAIEVTGILDTGSDTNNERRIVFSVSGVGSHGVTIERSFDSASYGFQPALTNFETTGPGSAAADTGTFGRTYEDEDDNLTVWYRAKVTYYDDTGSTGAGTAVVTATYPGGFKSGIARVTSYTTNVEAQCEVLTQFSDTGGTTAWEEGAWSDFRGYPSVPALHEGRLFHAGKTNIWASVTDDYINFSDDITDATAPISKTLGSGPINNIYWLLSLQTLVAGSSGSEISIRSSALDEPLTRTNAAARQFSTLGSANIRALKHDTEAFLVNRSKQRVYRIAIGFETVDYEPVEMSVLVPSLMEVGIVSCAIQRQPDSRFYFVLADGKCAVMTYEAEEDVLAWCLYETDGTIERVMTLPGIKEDRVFFLIKRTINGNEKRFLEKVMLETESVGDTGLSWLADSAVSFTTDTGRSHVITGLSHLEGESVIAWGSDTGAGSDTGGHGRDLSWDTGSPRVQKTYTVASGQITLDTGTGGVHHAVVGLAYDADFKSAKLAYGAEAGTALAQMKRVDKLALVLHKTHNNAVFFGRDTGDLDPMPRMIDGARVSDETIYAHFDQMSMPFPGLWDADSRIYIRAKAPRPATIIGLVPTVGTSEKV